MLSGAYSQVYKTAEKDQVEHLKTINREEKTDVITRSRRLTQETNKRRRAQAQKRKHVQQKEEKRRQYILSKRREEQKRATENYQRAPIPSSRPGSRRSSPTRATTGLEEALKLIRGSPTFSRQNSYSSITGQKKKSLKSPNVPSHDALNRPYFNKYSSSHLRSHSPAERAQEHAEMLDKSLRNYTSSRTLFEQQLEQHQQFLLEEQKMSLHKFNQAIQQEMDMDSKLDGTEEIPEDAPGMVRSESLSSVDSLEASQESFTKEKESSKVKTSNVSSSSYPRPVQPKATPIVGRVAPNSASVNTFMDSLENASKPFEVDYTSKNETKHENTISPGQTLNKASEQSFIFHAHSQPYNPQPIQEFPAQLQSHQSGNPGNTFFCPISEPMQLLTYATPASTTAQEVSVQKAEIPSGYVTQTHTLPANVSQVQTISQVPSDPYRQTTISTLAFTSTTSPSYTAIPATSEHCLPQTSVPSITAIPIPITMSHKSPGKNGTTANYLTSATKPVTAAEKPKVESVPVNKPADKGNISNGTLGLVHGRLAVLADIEAVARNNQPPADQTSQKKTLTHRSASNLEPREVKSILKRPETSKIRKSMSTGNLQKTGLNVKDSIEIARGQQRGNKKPAKKSVRFADLQYEDDIPEDTDSVDSNTDLATPVKKVNISQKPATHGTPTLPSRQRPMSAKVAGSNRVASARLSRAASAGATRPGEPQHAQDRPRAAAHIIAHSVEGNDYLNGSPGQKVTVVTNNFMGKAPASKSSQSQGVIHTSNNVYTDKNGEIQVSNNVLQKAGNVATAYQQKYVAAPVSSQPPQDAQKKMQEVYNENGLRIDRTPTDDEINWLWDKVRTCLNREPTAMEKKTASLATTDPNLSLSRQAAPVSNKYMDGTSLGLTGSTRVGPSIYGTNTVQQRAMNNMSARQKPPGSSTGSYMRKFGLLQQRKQPDSVKRSPQQQTFGPTTSKLEPQESDSPPVQRNDITESMATFLAAEHFAGRSMSDSQVQLAMEEAHQRKMEIRNNAKHRAGGPSALSLEEKKLMESLDRLDEKLKITESNYPAQQSLPHQYVHVGSRPPI